MKTKCGARHLQEKENTEEQFKSSLFEPLFTWGHSPIESSFSLRAAAELGVEISWASQHEGAII